MGGCNNDTAEGKVSHGGCEREYFGRLVLYVSLEQSCCCLGEESALSSSGRESLGPLSRISGVPLEANDSSTKSSAVSRVGLQHPKLLGRYDP